MNLRTVVFGDAYPTVSWSMITDTVMATAWPPLVQSILDEQFRRSASDAHLIPGWYVDALPEP